MLADEPIRTQFDAQLRIAGAERQPLRCQFLFGPNCEAVAALPWELLYHNGRFLARDTSIAILRQHVTADFGTPVALEAAELPLRVLLVLSEPVDASPIFPAEARRELLHGLRRLESATNNYFGDISYE